MGRLRVIADLVIVGGGPAAAHVLAALARARFAGRVVVIERGTQVGVGLPYGEAADPRHTLGRVATRRRKRGEVLRAQFEQAAKKLDAIVERETTARGIARRDGAWHIETDRGEIAAERAVLATGHWHTNRLAHVARAVDWRWDVRRLAAIGAREDVLVLGTSQSAIDLAIALADLTTGTITLASRRGLLPSVWGPLLGSKTAPGRAVQLDRLRGRDGVRLSDIIEAVRGDLAGAPPPAPLADGVATLRRDLEVALAAQRDRREIAWQAVLWPTVPAVFDLFPQVLAEDRLALAPHWYGALRHLEAIHTGNARRILALVDTGRVRVRALGTADPLDALAADRVIDARGHDPDLAASDDRFLHAVLASGHASPAQIPFADGVRRLDTGGLWVDPATFLVRDARGATANLHALGPLTLGQYPVYLGLWALRRAAARIARAI